MSPRVPQLLDVDEVGVALGVSRSTVRRLIRSGALAHVRVGPRSGFASMT